MRKNKEHTFSFLKNSFPGSSGFTLIEVLIALLVLSISITAVLSAINAQVTMIEKVQNANASRWVASNVIAKIEAGILPLTQEQKGKEDVFGQTWYWKAEAKNVVSSVAQVRIFVGLDEKQLDRQVALGFVPAGQE